MTVGAIARGALSSWEMFQGLQQMDADNAARTRQLDQAERRIEQADERLAFDKTESKRLQGNADRTFEENKRQFDAGQDFRDAQLEGQLILNATNENALADTNLKQTLEAGARILPRLRNYSLGTGKQAFEYDYGNILDNDASMTAEILMANPTVTFYRDERGNKKQLTVPMVEQRQDGRYMVTVLNEEGTRVPLSQNASDKADDIVVTFGRDQLLGLMKNTVDAYTGNAAAKARYGDYEAVFSSRLRLAASQAVANGPMGQANQGANRAVQAIIFDENTTTEDLEKIAADNGVDVELLRNESQVQAKQPEQTLVDVSDFTQTKPKLGYSSTGGVGVASSGSRDATSALRRIDESIATLEERVKTATGDKLDDLQNRLTEKDAQRRQLIEDANEKSLTFIKRKIRTLESKRDKAAAPRKAYWQEQIDTAYSKQEEIEMQLGTRPNPNAAIKLDPEAFRARLTTELNERKVTQQEVAQVQQFLAERQVTDPRQLATLPDEEAYQAIFVMAALEPDPTKRSAIIEEMTNLVTTGDPSMTRNMQETNDISAAKYMQSRDRYFLDVGIERNKLADDKEQAVAKAWERGGKILTGLVDESGRYQEPTREALVEATTLFGEYADQTGMTKAALRKPAMDVLYNFIAAKAASASPGTFEFSRRIDNWKNSDGELRLGKDAAAKLIRLSPDGQTLFFRDPTGGNANWRIPVSRFRESISAELLEPVLAVARQNSQAQSGAK